MTVDNTEKKNGSAAMTIMLPQPRCMVLCFALALLTSACAQHAGHTTAPLSAFEREIFSELNRARTNPAEYASYLDEVKQQLDAKLPSLPSANADHADASMRVFYETIAFLKASPSLPALQLSRGMSAAARDHLHDQLHRATVAHIGSDGSNLADRLQRYGSWEVGVGEAMAHGSSTAHRLVMQLVIDAHNPGRPYRLNIFNTDFAVAGVACGRNERYRNLCIITFAGVYHETASGTR